uniref:cAMP-dependent protein kinase n=2 Tax=Schistosoma mansoni TaxID=6183 RepID=A0A3Q0KIP7_SCHMA
MLAHSEFTDLYKEQSKLFHQLYHNNFMIMTAKLDDFERLRTLGQGGFGHVLLVRHIKTNKLYALKILSKLHIIKNHQINNVINEKRILASCNFTFIIQLYTTFKDTTYLYMVIEYAIGGDLFTLLRHMKKFPDNMVKFYGGQVILALEYLHYLTIVYRDLKPENLVIHSNGFIKLTDLGFAKLVPKHKRTWTLCGTPDYMAPEILLNKGYHYPVDWWAFGILLYEMTTGYPPFLHHDQMKTFELIINGEIKFTKLFNPLLKDLIQHLIQVDLSSRYGNLKNGINDIKNHHYFHDLNWLQLYHLNIKPPYQPSLLYTTYNDINHMDHSNELIHLNINDKEQFENVFDEF